MEDWRENRGRFRADSVIVAVGSEEMSMTVKSEPVAIGAAVIALVQAALVALTVLGVWDLSGEQQAALMAVVTAIVALVGGVAVRKRVTPVGPPDAGA